MYREGTVAVISLVTARLLAISVQYDIEITFQKGTDSPTRAAAITVDTMAANSV